jgi:hypothetical protein
MSVAQWTILGYGVGATLVSLGNAYLLTRVANLDITSIDNARAFWAFSLLLIVLLIGYDVRLMGKTRKGVRARIDSAQGESSKADSNATPALLAAAVNEIKQDGARKIDEQPVSPVR